jgi:hypothetical protein
VGNMNLVDKTIKRPDTIKKNPKIYIKITADLPK